MLSLIRRTIALTAANLTTACASARVAPAPIVTDRPDFTESAEVVPSGMVQVEGGYTFAKSGRAREHTAGELLVRIPVSAGVEVRAEPGSYVVSEAAGERTSGIDGATVGAKVMLARADSARAASPSLALVLGVTLPTGAREYRERKLQPAATLLAAWQLSERLSLGSNAGVSYASDGGSRFTQLYGSATVGYTLSERVGSYLEYFAFNREAARAPYSGYANGGLTFRLSDDTQLDARAGRGLDGRSRYFLGAGLSRRW
ncbi:MAG: transporter [Gemmatimonadaceae bacterium]